MLKHSSPPSHFSIEKQLIHLIGLDDVDFGQGRGRRGIEEVARRNLTRPVVPLPKDGTDWEWRECYLWFWSGGRLHPKQNPHAVRPRRPILHGAGRKEWEEMAAQASVTSDFSGLGMVSVVVPTIEERQAFHAQIWTCFCSQAWASKELIVVETYRTKPSEFFSSLQGCDDRLVFLSFQMAGGQEDLSIGAKRNIGQYVAVGDYVANFDDDDIYAPTYLTRMVGRMESSRADMITLSTWHVFDTTAGQFACCDPSAWIRRTGKKYDDGTVDSWTWGYGFSYVFRLDPVLQGRITYPDKCMSEDIQFFKDLRRFCGAERAVLMPDENGICLHVLHGKNTSQTFCVHEVHREDIQDLDIAELKGMVDWYLRTYPRIPWAWSSSLEADWKEEVRPRRRYRDLLAHRPRGGDLALRCPRGTTAGHVRMLCARKLDKHPDLLRLYRSQPHVLQGAGPVEPLPPAMQEHERIGFATQELWLLLPEDYAGQQADSCKPEDSDDDAALLLAAAGAYIR